MEYGLAQFEEDMEKIFSYTDDKPKMVMCTICGDWMTVPDDCSCGNLKKIYEFFKNDKYKGAVKVATLQG